MKYRTCVPVTGRTPGGMAGGVAAALLKSDYAEARLDFMRPADVPAALEQMGRSLRRTVCTLRPRSEGGMFAGTERERRSILRLVAEYGPYLLDVEYSALSRDAALAGYLRSAGTGVLVSWHDFGGTPGTAALCRRLEAMGRLSESVKMVGTARSPGDAARMLELYPRRGGRRLVSFAMGAHGTISRILCAYLGSPFTYASLGRPVAPGQLGLADTRRILGLGIRV